MSKEREQHALNWLKQYCGLHEDEVVGDAISVIMRHRDGRAGFWIVDAEGEQRRFKEVLAAYAEVVLSEKQ